ncbi:hypothetical protein BAE44_0005783, partial [Dichanthelium oligosanthes]
LAQTSDASAGSGIRTAPHMATISSINCPWLKIQSCLTPLRHHVVAISPFGDKLFFFAPGEKTTDWQSSLVPYGIRIRLREASTAAVRAENTSPIAHNLTSILAESLYPDRLFC